MALLVAERAASHDARDVLLRSLGARDFRNLARLELELPAEGVAIVGDNGHGKTNLLEAIAYFAVMRSIRGVRDRDLVRFGEKAFSLNAVAEGSATTLGAGEMRINVGFQSGPGTSRKQVSIDGVPVPRLADAFGAVPSIVIAPRDVALVAGAPGERRRYLDVLLAMTDRRYLAALQHYRSALVRRNATLRRAAARSDRREGGEEIAVWDAALAESGATIRTARAQWLHANAQRISAFCAAIGERERVSVRYAARPEIPAEAQGRDREDELRAQLARALTDDRARDIRRQLTHAGPHRDDLAISLGGHALRLVGSAGQQRTVAMALRLAARETIRDSIGRLPLMLLDDPFAELDATRTARILDLLRGALGEESRHGLGQLVIAIPRVAELPAELAPLKRLTIRDGVLGA